MSESEKEKFLRRKIRQKYSGQGKTPIRIADELPGIDADFINKVCDELKGVQK